MAGPDGKNNCKYGAGCHVHGISLALEGSSPKILYGGDPKQFRDQQVLSLVHVNLCGPMNTTSIISAKYFLLFVDDFSRKMWVYFLKLKYDVFK